MSKVKFETIPVAWSGKTELKYQSVATCGDRKIWGDPKRTEEEAYASFLSEVAKWKKAISEISVAIKEKEGKDE